MTQSISPQAAAAHLPEEESSLVDRSLAQASIIARERHLIGSAKARGYVTFEEVQALYPPGDEYLDAADALLVRLLELGVPPLPAASVRPFITAIAHAKKLETVSPPGVKPYVPTELDQLYLDEIRQFQVLSRDQERWIGIAMECPKLTLDNPGLLSREEFPEALDEHTLDRFFREVLKLAVKQGRFVSMRVIDNRSPASVSDGPDELVRLIRAVEARRQGNSTRRTSILARLLRRCPGHCRDNLFNLTTYLWALPASALRFLQKHILDPRLPISGNVTDRYRSDEYGQLGQQVKEIQHQAQQAKRTLILHNLRLVASTAYRYRDQGLPLVDLYQEGNLGLLKAVERFDYRQGNKFSTYAVWWIRMAITRAISEHCRTIRLPAHMHDALRKIHQAEETLRTKLNNEPGIDELAERCGLSVRQVHVSLKREPKIISLDTLLCCPEFSLEWDDLQAKFVQHRPCPALLYAQQFFPFGPDGFDDELGCLPCVLGDQTPEQLAVEQNVDYSMLSSSLSEGSRSGFESVVDSQLRTDLDRILRNLTVRERKVIEKRFGMNAPKETLEDIGNQYGLTRERIRQIEAKALRKLQHPVRKSKLRHYER